MRLVQVCNVGNICGGTAACAWSITRALPECRHQVLFLSQPTPETARVFAPVEICYVDHIDDDLLHPFHPDLVVLHNTAAARVGAIRSCVRLQYLHSRGDHAPADLTVACSQWLAQQCHPIAPVLYQPVPQPPQSGGNGQTEGNRHFDDGLRIGRICTPQLRKWPETCIDFYAELTSRFPRVQWEFVGCPQRLQKSLAAACGGRTLFFPASWETRQVLWRWHALLYHHPTLTESFGRTVAEAMRAECIPLVDARGGFTEQVVSGENGFLCADRAEFVAAIELLHAPEYRWRLARAARQSALDRFSLRMFACQFRKRLTDVLDSNVSPMIFPGENVLRPI